MLKVDNNMKQTIKDFAIAFLMWTSFTIVYSILTNL